MYLTEKFMLQTWPQRCVLSFCWYSPV